MALPWALAVLGLLPLLSAQSPECANLTENSISNATLDLISGKWFHVASAFRHPEIKQKTKVLHSAFLHFTPNNTENRLYVRQYHTVEDRCVYLNTYTLVHRQNGTMSKEENGTIYFVHLLNTKTPGIFMFSYNPNDKENMGVSIISNTTQLNEEQKKEFHEVLECLGMDKSEIIHADEKKDKCGPLEKQHEEERKKEQEGAKEDSA